MRTAVVRPASPVSVQPQFSKEEDIKLNHDEMDMNMATGTVRLTLNKPNEEVVKTLEELLIQAKCGKIVSIACVVSMGSNYETGNCWAGVGCNNMAILGELMALQHDIVANFVELREDRKDSPLT